MRATASLAIVAILLTLAGCGGGQGGDTGPPGGRPGEQPHRDSGGGAAQFRVEGGDNSVQEFGAEVAGAEFRQAAAALHGYLDARAARHWRAACGFLAPSFTRELRELAGRGGESCPDTLAILLGKTPDENLREAAVADVGSLRAEGDRGFLIYRGARDAVYAIGTENHRGSWKVSSLAATPLG